MKKLILIVMILVSADLYAQDLKTVGDTEDLSERIIDNFYKKNFEKGMDLAAPYWPLPRNELDNLCTQIKSQWIVIEERFGKTTGYELIRKEAIGSSFYRYYYLHKFENHAIYWSITYYKAEKNWLINSLIFKDDLEILFVPVK